MYNSFMVAGHIIIMIGYADEDEDTVESLYAALIRRVLVG